MTKPISFQKALLPYLSFIICFLHRYKNLQSVCCISCDEELLPSKLKKVIREVKATGYHHVDRFQDIFAVARVTRNHYLLVIQLLGVFLPRVELSLGYYVRENRRRNIWWSAKV
jgi:hypothetical protein